MFVDRVKIKIKAGNGGHGCTSFRRERHLARGGPDGGDGGNGGDVIIEACAQELNLAPLKFLNHYEAENGQPGAGKDRHGRRGRDTIIPVPPGTIIRDLDQDGIVVSDLDERGSRYVAGYGGKAGRGNKCFATSTNRAPRRSDPGEETEERWLELELKIIADIGLVGYPNAGKSSLLAASTNAKPAIAAYPFTTLTPQIGILAYDDYFTITIADIPGLIDGAHQNVGLGHEFLRHIERTRALVYVLDIGASEPPPWEALCTLQHELAEYDANLAERPAIVVANKMDEPTAAEHLQTLRNHTKFPIVPTCAVLEEGIDEFAKQLRTMLEHFNALSSTGQNVIH